MRTYRRTAWWIGGAAALAVTILFAPIMGVGWCRDAAWPGVSECGEYRISVVGIETTVWIWLVALAPIIIATAVAVVATRERTSESTPQ